MTALPLSNNAQLPTMLNRLLAAGGAAFDSLAGGGSKSRTGSNASPSSGAHRRTLSNASGGGPMRAGSMNQGPSGRVTLGFQGGSVHGSPHSFAQQQLQQHDTSPHSQPGTPMQHTRAPMLLMAPDVHTSPSQSSPRSLLGAPALKPLTTEARTPLSLTSGLNLTGGFFSGAAESSVWAPSPKAQVTPSNAAMQQQQQQAGSVAGVMRGLERFSFESRSVSAPDPAAAWAAAAHLDADKGVAAPSSSSYLSPHGLHGATLLAHPTQQQQQQQQPPLLQSVVHADESKLLSPRGDLIAPTAAPASLLPLGSPSPDSLASHVASKPLWGSPPSDLTSAADLSSAGISAASLLQSQLASHLQCSLADESASTHLLSAPVVTACCGAALCKGPCVEGFLAQAQSREKSAITGDESKQLSSPSHSAGVCRCGCSLSANDAQRLREAPIVPALQQLRDLVEHNGGGSSRSSSGSSGHGLLPSDKAAKASPQSA